MLNIKKPLLEGRSTEASISAIDKWIHESADDINVWATKVERKVFDTSSNSSSSSSTESAVKAADVSYSGSVSADNVSDALDTLNADIMDASSSISSVRSSVTSLQSDMATAKSNISTAQGNITTLQSDVTGVKSDVTTLQTKVSSAESNITTLLSLVKFKNINGIKVECSETVGSGNTATVTVNLTNYGFTKTPYLFLRDAYMCSVLVNSVTTTSVSISLVNLYLKERNDLSCYFYMLEPY